MLIYLWVTLADSVSERRKIDKFEHKNFHPFLESIMYGRVIFIGNAQTYVLFYCIFFSVKVNSNKTPKMENIECKYQSNKHVKEHVDFFPIF
jgi:hypothetical protein